MSRRNCKIIGCGNNTQRVLKNEGRALKMYRLPGKPWERERRQIWLNFAKPEGESDTWAPPPNKEFFICSDHFVGGCKGNYPLNLNYNPTIRPPSNKVLKQTRKLLTVSPAKRRGRKKLQKSILHKAKLIRRGRRLKISMVKSSNILEPNEDDAISKTPSSFNISKRKANDQAFSINTRNMCLLCFRTCSVKRNPDHRQLSNLFKTLMRFLNVNIWQLCGLSEEVALSQRNVDLLVTMCSECESVSQQVFKLYPQFEKIVMQLDECCRVLQGGMESGRKTEEQTGCYRSKIKSRISALVFQANVAEKIRNETRSKCTKRLKNAIPQLRITKKIHPPNNLSAAAVLPELKGFTPVPNKRVSSLATCDKEPERRMSVDSIDHQIENLCGNYLPDDDDCIELLAVKKLCESAKPSSTYTEKPSSVNLSTLPPHPVQKSCPLSKKKKLFAINDLQPKSSNVKILYSCYICKTKLPSKESIKDHFATHHSKNKAPTQTASAESLATKTKPTSKSVPQVSQGSSKSAPNARIFDTCKICADGILVNLLPHMVMTHGTSHYSKIMSIAPKWSDADVTNIVNNFINSYTVSSTTSAGLLTCKICTKGFKLKHSFNSHIIKSHYTLLTSTVKTEAKKQITNLQDRERINPGQTKARITCLECAKAFETIEKLSKHKRVEHNLVTIKCDMCDNEYLDDIVLNFHRRSTHNVGIKPVKKIKTEKNEVVKAKAIKQKTKRIKVPKICPICSKLLCSQTSLKLHLTTHSDKKEYCCDQCGTQFRLYSTLRRHLLTHSGVKRLACTFCPKRFATNYSLNLHVRTHTNEKPYQCDQCGIAFTQKSSLNMHAKQHK